MTKGGFVYTVLIKVKDFGVLMVAGFYYFALNSDYLIYDYLSKDYLRGFTRRKLIDGKIFMIVIRSGKNTILGLGFLFHFEFAH